jgi:hypothetical protein
MNPCNVALMTATLLPGLPVDGAATAGLGPEDRVVLADYARDTWRSIAAMGDRGPLPADCLRRTPYGGWVADGLTSPTNIAVYLWSAVAAEDLRLISREEADQRIGQTLATLGQLERSHGFYFNWYEPETGQPARIWPGGGKVRPFLSVVDNGWLAAALMVIGNLRPEFRPTTDALLEPMNFGFFYDAFDPTNPVVHPGLLRGGYWPDNDTFAGFHYGALNTEPRIASYIGIARGDLPQEHYYRMFRSCPEPMPNPTAGNTTYAGVVVNKGTLNYRAMEIVPTWEGTMFEALMVSLLVPEAEWAPESWGVNHPRYVRAQIEYGLNDAQWGYWGLSAASAPGGGYGVYGVAALGVRTQSEKSKRPSAAIVTPYASFLALPFAPREALNNLKALADHFAIYGPYGFHDSVDVVSGQVSDRVLVLDQGMILASLARIIGSDPLRRGFCTRAVETKIRPLIAQERFEASLDPAPRPMKESAGEEKPSFEDLSFPPAQGFLDFSQPPFRSQHLLVGLLTAAGGSGYWCQLFLGILVSTFFGILVSAFFWRRLWGSGYWGCKLPTLANAFRAVRSRWLRLDWDRVVSSQQGDRRDRDKVHVLPPAFPRPARVHGPEELQELLAGPRREAVVRVGDNVRVDTVGQVKPDRDPLRARTLRVVIGHGENPGRRREPDGDWRVRPPLRCISIRTDSRSTGGMGKCPRRRKGTSKPSHGTSHTTVFVERTWARQEAPIVPPAREQQWTNDNIPVAGETFREFVTKLYQRNELVKGEFRLAPGEDPVQLSRITCPLMLLTASGDHLVPPSQTEGIVPHVGTKDIKSMTLTAGHIVLAVSTKAHKTFWPDATRWLADRSTAT